MEEVDGGESGVVTTQQPRSPVRPAREEGTERSALEAAEQQMILIHDEYKKLLREKEVMVRFILLPATHMLYMYMYTCIHVHICWLRVYMYMYIHVWHCSFNGVLIVIHSSYSFRCTCTCTCKVFKKAAYCTCICTMGSHKMKGTSLCVY